MNTAAMTIPKNQLVSELEQRITLRKAEQAARDARYGSGRITIGSYMEGIGWPELFDFAIHRFYDDTDFFIEQSLRQSIFWADNVADDAVPSLTLTADAGMYWDMTLFGLRIRLSPIGVPEFLPHPFAQSGELSDLGTFDFYTSGYMPRLIKSYQRLREIVREQYDDKIAVAFPSFNSGPLCIYVQLRGFENFLDDVAERPEQLLEALSFLTAEKYRFAEERRRFLGEAALPPTVYLGDDWVNIPFISPRIFREFVVPMFQRIRANEGPVTGFHTCGKMDEIVRDLLGVFPELMELDVSGWNDVHVLDALVDPKIAFGVSIINTVSLSDDQTTQREKLAAIVDVGRRRKVSMCAQAIVKLYPTYEENMARLGRFIALAREVFQQQMA
jgi:hypothetical protein